MTETAALRPPQAAQALDGGAATGGLHPGGFVSATDPGPGQPLPYREDRSRPLALRWFTVGAPYRLFGLFDTGRHLYGVDPPGRRSEERRGGEEWRSWWEFSLVLFRSQPAASAALVHGRGAVPAVRPVRYRPSPLRGGPSRPEIGRASWRGRVEVLVGVQPGPLPIPAGR